MSDHIGNFPSFAISFVFVCVWFQWYSEWLTELSTLDVNFSVYLFQKKKKSEGNNEHIVIGASCNKLALVSTEQRMRIDFQFEHGNFHWRIYLIVADHFFFFSPIKYSFSSFTFSPSFGYLIMCLDIIFSSLQNVVCWMLECVFQSVQILKNMSNGKLSINENATKRVRQQIIRRSRITTKYLTINARISVELMLTIMFGGTKFLSEQILNMAFSRRFIWLRKKKTKRSWKCTLLTTTNEIFHLSLLNDATQTWTIFGGMKQIFLTAFPSQKFSNRKPFEKRLHHKSYCTSFVAPRITNWFNFPPSPPPQIMGNKIRKATNAKIDERNFSTSEWIVNSIIIACNLYLLIVIYFNRATKTNEKKKIRSQKLTQYVNNAYIIRRIISLVRWLFLFARVIWFNLFLF